jgi:hypothetical protein
LKVKSLCLIKHHAIEMDEEMDLRVFLTQALAREGFSDSSAGRFTPGEGALDNHWIGA